MARGGPPAASLRRDTYHVLGGTDGPVSLDGHIALDGDDLRSETGARRSVVRHHATYKNSRHARAGSDGKLFVDGRVAPSAGERALTFLALKVLRWVANWGRTAVVEAMACIFSVVVCADMVYGAGRRGGFRQNTGPPSEDFLLVRIQSECAEASSMGNSLANLLFGPIFV